jgi:hypothetical protein
MPYSTGMPSVKNWCTGYIAAAAVLVACIQPAAADRLYHTDGTVIEGRILSENANAVQIDTKYGKLNYDRSDLVRVERSPTAVSVTSGTAAAAPVNLMKYIPQGPVNPLAPPQIPMLVTLAPKPPQPATSTPTPR